MNTDGQSRRAFAGAAALLSLAAVGAARSAPAKGATPAGRDLGISHGAATIHQEVMFKANAARVYQALTDARQFDKVMALSAAGKSMGLKLTPAEISTEPGGAFSLFGGYISGRQVELTPNIRIVQVWRSASWPTHVHSIARFELSERASGARLAFDHSGFPSSEAEHLATGWHVNYWEPLAKFLA